MSRTTASPLPSGAQSAHCTCSSISRGAPPESGARASVPMLTHAPIALLLSSTAISDVGEIDMSCVRPRPMERDSGASGRAVNTSTGFPCHAALYRIVCPSGAKRADRMLPRRKVSWR